MSLMNSNRLYAFACALSLYALSAPFSGAARAADPAPARADNTDKAIAAVKNASDEDLRKEIERRQKLRKGAARADTAAPVRGFSAAPSGGLSSLSDAQLGSALHATSRSIYGGDQRKDWYQLTPADRVEPLARASVALFDAAKIEMGADGMAHFKARSFQDLRRLCPSQQARFAAQPSAAYCSGTLVRPDLVLTAGHCIREVSRNQALPATVANIKFVFGYVMKSANANPASIPAGNVFTGKEVVGGESAPLNDPHRHDWAVVRLDRNVPASVAEPVTNWQTEPVAKDEPVFVIGFPAGMPLKYAPGAKVRDASNGAWFSANLDTFGGNSGSGVYHQTAKKLVGVLVQGEIDYYPDETGTCNMINVCPDNGCSGEVVSRLNQVRMP